MDLSCPLAIARFVPAKAKLFGVIFWPYNKGFIDQACSVKMAGYWPRSFLRFYGPRLRLGPQKRKKEFGQYPAILTSRLVNNAYLLFLQRSFWKQHFNCPI